MCLRSPFTEEFPRKAAKPQPGSSPNTPRPPEPANPSVPPIPVPAGPRPQPAPKPRPGPRPKLSVKKIDPGRDRMSKPHVKYQNVTASERWPLNSNSNSQPAKQNKQRTRKKAEDENKEEDEYLVNRFVSDRDGLHIYPPPATTTADAAAGGSNSQSAQANFRVCTWQQHPSPQQAVAAAGLRIRYPTPSAFRAKRHFWLTVGDGTYILATA